MSAQRLDEDLLQKLARKRGKKVKYIREQVSKLAHRQAITSEAALILMARKTNIGTANFLRKQLPHIQEQVRTTVMGESARPALAISDPTSVPIRINSLMRKARQGLRRDASTSTTGEVERRLVTLHPQLGAAYQQVIRDLNDGDRASFRGTANEMREVLRDLLDLLAPDDEVMKQEWYTQEPKINGPSRRQRLKYIFGQRYKEMGTVETGTSLIEELITNLTVAIYERSNRAAHTSRLREELRRILGYLNPLLLDLLDAGPSNSPASSKEKMDRRRPKYK